MAEFDLHLQPTPGKSAFDYALAIAKASSLAFPFLGAGVTLFDLLTTPARGKRMNDWCEELRLRINDLSDKIAGLTPERLAKDEAFISAFGQATQAALRTHEKEKLDALRNALLNVATGNAPEDDLQLVFLNFVDSFTPTHLHVLRLFESPDGAARERLRGQRDLSDQAVRDLDNRGLLKDKRPIAARASDSYESLVIYPWEVTNLGKQFLAFIRSPEGTKP